MATNVRQRKPMAIENEDIQQAVSANIRALMGRYRVRQADLAEILGVGTPGISKRLAGKTAFKLKELEAIADYFEKPVSELLVTSNRTGTKTDKGSSSRPPRSINHPSVRAAAGRLTKKNGHSAAA